MTETPPETPPPHSAPAAGELYYLVMRLARSFSRAAEDIAWHADISVAEFSILLVLGEGAPLSSAQLARRAFMTPQASHQLVSGLLTRRLVESLPHPTNRRVLLVSPTEEGWGVVERSRALLREMQDRATSRLSARDRAALEGNLLTVADTVLGGWFGDPEAEAEAASRRTDRRRGESGRGMRAAGD
ncbi:MarR family winged helix-turn-helix transcriptional regulator [Naasia lichenicola]|uniref:MarR family transcriptional regulator n=1 Tax=Naasia lichenicola TaxID=2565933 RepID=A0A4S4FMW9_9MICO|nr:MarR family transcriptional regulator [Naasia lichenicola]THG31598.1 MarR family transcriptional regulator [Naasia lichenicola]